MIFKIYQITEIKGLKNLPLEHLFACLDFVLFKGLLFACLDSVLFRVYLVGHV